MGGLDHEVEKSGLYRVIGELVEISEQEKASSKLFFRKIDLSENCKDEREAGQSMR